MFQPIPLTKTAPAGTKATCTDCGRSVTLRRLGTHLSDEGISPSFAWQARANGATQPVHCLASSERHTPYHKPAGLAGVYVGETVGW